MIQKLILPFLLLISFSLNAQDLQIGARAGVNFSNFTGQHAGNLRVKPGIHIGPYMKIGLNNTVFFQPELLFSMKGYADRNDWTYSIVRRRQSLYYLDLPLMTGFHATEQFKVLVGLQPSFLLGGKYKVKSSDGYAYSDTNVDWVRNVDLGLIGGFEYELESGVNIGLRFSYGLATLSHDGNYLANNINLQLTVGYSFVK